MEGVVCPPGFHKNCRPLCDTSAFKVMEALSHIVVGCPFTLIAGVGGIGKMLATTGYLFGFAQAAASAT